jgi:hypothetical protein
MASNNEIGKPGLEGLEEQIYSIAKKIIEKHLPGKLLHFELDWHVLWGEIRKFWDKHPSEWKVSDIDMMSSPVFNYPSDAENFEVLDISATVALISRKLMKSSKNLSRKEKGKIVNDCIKQLSPPGYTHQDLLSLFLKTGKGEKFPVEPKTKIPSPKEEKKKYVMLTDTGKKVENLSGIGFIELLKEQKRRATEYRFLIDEVNYELYYNGERIVKSKKEKPVKPAWRAFIYLLLRKSKGIKDEKYAVSYEDIYKFVYKDEFYIKSSADNTVQKWVSKFKLYINDDKLWFLRSEEKYGYRYNKNAVFNFCIFMLDS